MQVEGLLEQQRLCVVHTGSPQLDYELFQHAGPLVAWLGSPIRGHTTFGLELREPALVVLDGYWLDYLTGDYERAEFRVAAGYHAITLGTSESNQHSQMLLHFWAQPRLQRLPGFGDVELIYSVP